MGNALGVPPDEDMCSGTAEIPAVLLLQYTLLPTRKIGFEYTEYCTYEITHSV